MREHSDADNVLEWQQVPHSRGDGGEEQDEVERHRHRSADSGDVPDEAYQK